MTKDNSPVDSRSLFADVEMPMISVQDAVEKGKLEYMNYAIEYSVYDETKEPRYSVHPRFKLVLHFRPDGSSSNGINVYAERYDNDDPGKGSLKDGRLIVRNQDSENIDAKVDNLVYFSSVGKSEWNQDNTVYTMFIEDSLYDAIENATPVSEYQSQDGMIIRLKLYKTPVAIDGIKAIVRGEIENATEAMTGRYVADYYPDDYLPYIYSVMTQDDSFIAEYDGFDEGCRGPLILWSQDELTIPADPENGLKEIVLKRMK